MKSILRHLWNDWMTVTRGFFYTCRNADCRWTGWKKELLRQHSKKGEWSICPKCKSPWTMAERVAYRLSGLDPMTEEQQRIYCESRGIACDD